MGWSGRPIAFRQGYQENASWRGVDPAAVAAYYRSKGYVVRDGVRMPGAHGSEHKVPLLAEGPLGSLAIFFGDFAGVDGPEMGGARKVAREIGATPVLAADEFGAPDRQVAARLGVVLLDASTLANEAAPAAKADLGVDSGRAWPGLAPMPTRRAKEPDEQPHPWPSSGRLGGRDGPATRAVDVEEMLSTPAPTPAPSGNAGKDGEGLWKRPRSPALPATRPARSEGSRPFAWLGADVPTQSSSKGPTALAIEYDDVVAAKSADGPDERLGDAIELEPTMDELRRKAGRDRLLRRLFWLLFASVVLYLFALWWL